MTTLMYDGNTLTVNNNGRIAKLTPEQFYARTFDFDLQETAVKAIALQGEAIPVSNVSYARGLKPRNAQIHGLAQ